MSFFAMHVMTLVLGNVVTAEQAIVITPICTGIVNLACSVSHIPRTRLFSHPWGISATPRDSRSSSTEEGVPEPDFDAPLFARKRHNRRQRYSSSRIYRFLGIAYSMYVQVAELTIGRSTDWIAWANLRLLNPHPNMSSGRIRLSTWSSSYGPAPSTTDSGTLTRISCRWATFWDNALHWNPFRPRPVPVVSTQPYPSFRISDGPCPGHVRLSSSGSATLAESQLKQSYTSLNSSRSLPKRMLMGGASWIGSLGEIYKRKSNPDIPGSQDLRSQAEEPDDLKVQMTILRRHHRVLMCCIIRRGVEGNLTMNSRLCTSSQTRLEVN